MLKTITDWENVLRGRNLEWGNDDAFGHIVQLTSAQLYIKFKISIEHPLTVLLASAETSDGYAVLIICGSYMFHISVCVRVSE